MFQLFRRRSHRAYLHMYNTAYARRNVRQRAQLILQRVLCAFFFE